MLNKYLAAPEQWEQALAPAVPVKRACDWVKDQLRNVLELEDELSTTRLAEALYPTPLYPTVHQSLLRKRLFNLLSTISKEGELATPQAARPGKGWSNGKMVRPLIWHGVDIEARACPGIFAKPEHTDGPDGFILHQVVGRLDLFMFETNARLAEIEKHVGIVADVDEHGTAEPTPEDQSGK